MAEFLGFMPYLLIVLSGVNMLAIVLARKAIIGGDWFRHRSLMLVALGLWGLSLGLFAVFLLRNGITGLWADMRPLYGVYLGAALGVSVLLALTLWRMLKHLHLPHKLMGRKAIPLWMIACLIGVITFVSEIV